MNDPNGLVFHEGLWHLFYQHHPHSLEWGPMHWGHAVSRDLHAWQHRPIALGPDALGAIFSGSTALTEDGEIVACFTHHRDDREAQSLAFSRDGFHFEKWQGNPVLDTGQRDFRDPKIFRFQNQWRMIVAALETAQIFASDDLKTWNLLSDLAPPFSLWGWECPDLFPLGDCWVLIGSFIVPNAPHQTHYWLGDFDGTGFTATCGPNRLSFGPDDYAAVTWNNAPDGRRVAIGWMNAWTYANQTPANTFRGAMTLPRELGLIQTATGPRLTQNPTPELLQWRGPGQNALELSPFPAAYELELQWQPDSTAIFAIDLGGIRLGYDGPARELFLDRTGDAEIHPGFHRVFRAPLELKDKKLLLRVFADTQSVEVFAQDGQIYGAALWFGEKSPLQLIGARNPPGFKVTLWPLSPTKSQTAPS